MTDTRFIKPAKGMTVLDPERGNAVMPAHGRGVVWNSQWQRLLDEGEIEETTEKAVLAAEEPVKAKETEK